MDENKDGTSKRKHFVLVHGACHGAWCWYKLVVLLEGYGHEVTALDLAASGRNAEEQLKDLRTIDDYHKPLYSFFDELAVDGEDDKVIIVGHSMGGYAVSCAMERFPHKIAYAVFASAFMLSPDLTMDQLAVEFVANDFYMDSEEEMVEGSGGTQKQITFGNEFMAAKVYQNSPPEDLKLAILLTRPTIFFGDYETKKQLLVTAEKFGSVRRAFIVGDSDKSILVNVQRWMIEKNPPDMTAEIEGADHMLMISKPQELCSILLQIAEK